MPRLSLSTWTLHSLLGRAWYDETQVGELANRSDLRPVLSLVDVPEAIVEHGIRTLEICHFHFPSVEDSYLAEVRAAADSAGVELFSILIDTGDITHPDPIARHRDVDTIRRWMERAAHCGASHVRVIAGDREANEEAVMLSAQTLTDLAGTAFDLGLRVITENFKTLASTPETVLDILSRCDGHVGLCADFGNFPSASRESDLEAILPSADSIHAKADYSSSGEMDRVGFEVCLETVKEAKFDGPVSLIYQDPGDTWAGVEEMKEIIVEFL